jgi:hypothetical protein
MQIKQFLNINFVILFFIINNLNIITKKKQIVYK